MESHDKEIQSDDDHHLRNNPFKIPIAVGDYTFSVADFTGTFKSQMKGFNG